MMTSTPPTAHPRRANLRRLALAYFEQWWALGFGLAACFLVLLATKQLGNEVRVFCALGAIVVIVMWLATGGFRRDGLVCAASSTLALLPIAALECGWMVVEERGLALLIETFCLAILFVGQIERVGKEAMAMLRHEMGRGRPDRAAIAAFLGGPGSRIPGSRIIVIRCCTILLGLLIASSAIYSSSAVARDAPLGMADDGEMSSLG